jgi:hypothetical protein
MLDVGGHLHGYLIRIRTGDLQRHGVRALARGHLLKADQDLVTSFGQRGLKGHALRILVMEMFLAMKVSPVEPQVRRPVRGQGKGHLLR